MTSSRVRTPWVTGLGVTSSIGHGREAFLEGLLRGASAFSRLQREGRVHPGLGEGMGFVGCEMGELPQLPARAQRHVRTLSLSARSALACVGEAWAEAGLGAVDPTRVGLIVGGSNIQQRELVLTHRAFEERIAYMRPSYAMTFLDSDVCGVCTEVFGIRGPAFSVGGASAAGLLAVLQARDLVRSGVVDACIAVGALMDLSYFELQAFCSSGAMANPAVGENLDAVCRPYDRQRRGFVFGEASAALVVASPELVATQRLRAYASIVGGAVVSDAHRHPEPSVESEVTVMERALTEAGCKPAAIDYVNPHATGSRLGDEVELTALRKAGLGGAAINTTKSLVGHGLSAAGAVEVVATLLQMRVGRLHACKSLDEPIEPDFNWVRNEALSHSVKRALCLSYGFGGVNCALVLENIDAHSRL